MKKKLFKDYIVIYILYTHVYYAKFALVTFTQQFEFRSVVCCISLQKNKFSYFFFGIHAFKIIFVILYYVILSTKIFYEITIFRIVTRQVAYEVFDVIVTCVG